MSRFTGFVGPTYQTRSPNFDAERCVNWIPELAAPGAAAKSPIHYSHTPGLSLFTTISGASNVRCLWAGEDRLFVVAGTKYGEILSSGTFQDRGTIENDNRPATIHTNGAQLIIRSGTKLYCDNGGAATGSNAVYQVDSASATYLDGYFISLNLNSNAFRLSALLDGTSWPAADTATRIGTADRVVSLQAHGERLWIVGRRNAEAWWNSGNAGFPFERVQGSSVPQGCVLPDTIAALDGSLFFVGEDDHGSAAVYRTNGYQLRRVSNPAIEFKIANPSPFQFLAWTYEQEGHKFYVLTEYGGTFTWVYDAATDLWHERAYWTGTAFAPHLGRCHAFTTPGFDGLAGAHYVGARNSGKVYLMSLNLYQDEGGDIRRYRQAPHVSEGEDWNFFSEFKLDMALTGTPNLTMKWSDDDGSTFTADKTPVLTSTSNATKRAVWRRLGRSRDRIFAVTLHGYNNPAAITDAFLKVHRGLDDISIAERTGARRTA